MIIKRSTGLITLLLLGLINIARGSLVGITDLRAQSGTAEGSVDLQWSEPLFPTARYVIKYQAGETPITTEPMWGQANRTDQSPLNQQPPTPLSPGSLQTVTLTGLRAGSSYAFSVRGFDSSNVTMGLSNSPTVQARVACTASGYDGEGNIAVTPNIVNAGDLTTYSLVFSAGAHDVQTGGVISFRMPDLWAAPQTNSQGTPGYVVYTTSNGATGVTLSSTLSGQTIDIKIESGTLLSGKQIVVQYVGFTCDTGGTAKFRVKSKVQQCGGSQDLTNSPANVSIQQGLPRYVSFPVFDLPIVINQVTPLRLAVRDYCGREVTAVNSAPVLIKTLADVGGVTVSDPVALLSTASAFTSPFTSSTVTITGGQSGTTVYYQITSDQYKPSNNISITFNEFQPPYNQVTYFARVSPITSGVTDASVDVGVRGTLQTATFTPDNDGVADSLFIHATLPSAVNWNIQISKDNFATIARTLYGYGTDVNISWDGYTDGGTSSPSIAPPGTYAIRINGGATLSNSALSATLSASGVSGRIINADNSTPLTDAEVQVYGVSQRFARTDASGNFFISGLKAGAYTLSIRKTGYGQKDQQITVPDGTLNVGDVSLTKQSILRVSLKRPNTGALNEVWGNLNAHDANWTAQAYASVHFGEGVVTSDAGDNWNVNVTTYTDLTFPAGKAIVLNFNIPGLGANDLNVAALGANETRELSVLLERRPDLGGKITRPAADASGLWVSVEARLRNSKKRFYGGGYIQPGDTNVYYRVPGVQNGVYDVVTYAPGFIGSTLVVTVANDTDVTNADVTLSEGGNFSGQVTVSGDTTALGNGGFIGVNISAQSRTSGTGSFSVVSVPVDPVQATASYQIKGLADGTYDVFPYLDGFELVPQGPKTVFVTGGSGSLNLTFQQYNGNVEGTITLPAGHTDFSSVSVELASKGSGGSTLSMAPDTAGHYQFNHVATGFFSLRAFYTTTGFLAEKSAPVVNGQTTTVNLNVAGNTYSLQGKVTTQASSPFNSLAYYVSGTTPTLVQTNSGNTTLPANRIEASRVDSQSNYNQNNTGGLPYYDLRQTFVAAVALDGSYSFSQLPPGVYKLKNNGEMDNNLSNGNEIVESYQAATIKDANVSDINFALTDGVSLQGTLSIANGDTESGRSAKVYLMDKSQKRVAETSVFLTGTSIAFTLTHVPAGTFTLSAQDDEYPNKYWSDSSLVEVKTSNISGLSLTFSQAGKIQGQLRIKNGDTVTHTNLNQLLPSSFYISAVANPFKPNGYGYASGDILDSNDQFTLVVGAGTYDLELLSSDLGGQAALSRGVKPIVGMRLSGIEVTAGQTKDVGIIELVVGEKVSGVVSDADLVPLPNIVVKALEVGTQNHDNKNTQVTDKSGKYTINGLDPKKKYIIIASPFPESDDDRYAFGFDGTRYGEARRTNVSPAAGISIDFKLKPAPGSISGVIRTPDNGPLLQPFNHNDDSINIPGATVIANLRGNIPLNNPLGDYEIAADANGSFTMAGLAAGQYDLWLIAKEYGSVKLSNVNVGAGNTDIGTQTLVAGSKLTGKIFDSAGKSIRTTVCNTLVAVANGFADILIANLSTDSSDSITAYELSGFKANTTYNILAFNDDNNITSLGTVVVNSNSEKNLQVTNSSLSILPVVTRNDNGSLTIRFGFTAALDNSSVDLDNNGTADSSQSDKLVNVATGGGTLAFADDFISSDRKNLTVTYTPADNVAFSLRLTATFNIVDSGSGSNRTVDQNFTFYPGLGNEVTRNIPNASGGTVSLDAAEFSGPAGFIGDDSDKTIEVKFREAATIGELPANANPHAHSASVLAAADRLGMKAYPTEMAGALTKIRKLDIDPFSSFYDIFLPAGVSHFFPQGKEARLCLVYDSAVSDPSSLNIYYYNPNTNEYLLESQNKSVDTENERICVNIAHASVFTILGSSVGVISGGGYNGDLAVINFPNPFNLKSKTVTLQNPGSASASQTIDGTMIKMSIPPDLFGSIEIKVYDVAGDLVRTLTTAAAAGGAHYYLEWDGKNDHGAQVASGTYLARFTIGGSHEKFFKMAVLK